MHGTSESVLAHHRAAASMWGYGGKAYNQISFAISDALAHAAQRLNPKPGQEILDVATGTGWSARNAARAGARVTAIDISPELLEAGEELSSHCIPQSFSGWRMRKAFHSQTEVSTGSSRPLVSCPP